MVAEVIAAHATGRPVLVGTLTVEESARVADALGAAGVACAVLNAKNDEAEARIVARAGARRCGDDLDQHGRPRHRHPAGSPRV